MNKVVRFDYRCYSQRGFTLVEMSIVLVIIGLLLGGVLKGRTFIESAKQRALIDEARSLVASVISYQEKYGSYPGDHMASDVWDTARNGNQDGAIQEWNLALQHLALAGFITGTFNGVDDRLQHTYGGYAYVGFQNIRDYGAANLLRFDNLPRSAAKALDDALDDGVPDTGVVRINDGNYTDNPNTRVAFTGYYF